ncbi:MAG: LamG-like jellyroll fold domain-containing protein [bacterium]
MIRQSFRRFAFLSGVLAVTFGYFPTTQANLNLFSVLKGFFNTSFSSAKQEKVSPLTVVNSQKSMDYTKWNERVKNRDAWRAQYVVNHRLIDILNNGLNDGVISIASGDPGLDPTNPDVAYDPMNNRYLAVWEEETSPGVFNIMGQFRDAAGNPVGSPTQISAPRTNQGCFYANFDSDNGAISTPGLDRCQHAANPAVAYNNGKYLIAWELGGTADFPADGPGKNFTNIIAKIVNASDLAPVSPDWEEGIMISRVWIASNVGTPVANDGQVQAWAKSTNPDVAPKQGGNGFVVTFQSDKDFIGCVDANRRDSTSIYGRYIDQNFSPTGGATNKPLFAIYTDPSTMTSTCPTLDNVMRAQKPRITFNSAQSSFTVAFEVARAASPTKGDIGAKTVTLNGSNDATVDNAMMPGVVANAPEGTTFHNPDLASFHNDVLLAFDDGNAVSIKRLTDATATVLPLSGSGAKTEPRLGGNLGATGTRPSGTDPEKILVTYTQGGTLKGAVVDNAFAITRGPLDISGATTANHVAEVASDFKDFFVVWAGTTGGMEQVFGAKVLAENPVTNQPPTAPTLGAQPADGVTWAPTRLYLSWSPSTDPDAGDTITYDVYFAIGASPGATPYKSGLTTTNFVIQASTDGRAQFNPDGGVTPIYLAPSQNYAWKICAKDNHGASTCSPSRAFHTDNSVKAWWRFDENPAGPVCTGGSAGETVCDYSGNNNHGVPNGSPTWVGPLVDILNHALQFDGVNDYVSIANDATLNPDSYSIVTKIKTNGKATEQEVLDKRQPGGAGPAGYNIRLEGGSFPMQMTSIVSESNGTEHYLPSAGVIADNTDYQLVATFDSSTGIAKNYSNGAFLGMMNFGVLNRTSKSTVSLFLGDTSFSAAPSAFSYKGLIDEIILVNRAMPDVEISNNSSSTN